DPLHRSRQHRFATRSGAPGLAQPGPRQDAGALRRQPDRHLGPDPRRMAHPAGETTRARSRAMTVKLPNPIPARMRGLNRAEICDVNFQEYVRDWNGDTGAAPRADAAVLPGSALDARGFRELFESQLVSRHLDLMARVLRVQNKVFYTIGSSGHEGNAMVARLTRHTDPAFLHYRSGGFM